MHTARTATHAATPFEGVSAILIVDLPFFVVA
jgi:hypothetical protein